MCCLDVVASTLGMVVCEEKHNVYKGKTHRLTGTQDTQDIQHTQTHIPTYTD
jgi:hypothetical protein